MTLADHLTKSARLALAQAAVRAIAEELKEGDNPLTPIDRRVTGSGILASQLGVSRRTVERWLSGGIQSCNVNAEKLVKVSLGYAFDETLKILHQDLEEYRQEIASLKLRQRVVGD